MNVVLTRVDSRLIHGTIVENWANYLKATRIVVANDEIIHNGLRLAVLEIAVPSSISLGVFSIKVAVKKFIDGDFKNDRVILLFANVKDAYQAIKTGLPIDALNLGDYKAENGMMRFSDRVILGEDDMIIIKSILMCGTAVYIQSLPNSKSTDINQMIRRFLKDIKK